MEITNAGSQGGVHGDAEADLKEIVMGLNWDPPPDGISVAPSDLDAMCVLFNEQGKVLDVIYPGHLRSADDSVIHTGDSRTGAGAWDDERIFVFLESLPPAVSALAFVVVSATGHAFGEARGASCHVSNRVSEDELVRLELTRLAECTAQTVATMQRGATGWKIVTDAQIVQADLLAKLRTLPGKKNASPIPAQMTPEAKAT